MKFVKMSTGIIIFLEDLMKIIVQIQKQEIQTE